MAQPFPVQPPLVPATQGLPVEHEMGPAASLQNIALPAALESYEHLFLCGWQRPPASALAVRESIGDGTFGQVRIGPVIL